MSTTLSSPKKRPTNTAPKFRDPVGEARGCTVSVLESNIPVFINKDGRVEQIGPFTFPSEGKKKDVCGCG